MDTLDCQNCGAVLAELDAAQVAQVAERPYDFVRYCPTCARSLLDTYDRDHRKP